MLEIIWMTAFLSDGLIEVDLQHCLLDLTPVDFIYWIYINALCTVSQWRIWNLRIVAACAIVTPEISKNGENFNITWTSVVLHEVHTHINLLMAV